jgi:hypothetical protein
MTLEKVRCAKCKRAVGGHISTTYLGFRTKICFACATDPKFSRHTGIAIIDQKRKDCINSRDRCFSIEEHAVRKFGIPKGAEFSLERYRRLDGKPYIFIAA